MSYLPERGISASVQSASVHSSARTGQSGRPGEYRDGIPLGNAPVLTSCGRVREMGD